MTSNKKLSKEEELNLADLILSKFGVHGSSPTFFGDLIPELVSPSKINKSSKSFNQILVGEKYLSNKSKTIYSI